MSHTFTTEQTNYWKHQAYALMVYEGMSARFAKGQVETEHFLDDVMHLVSASGGQNNTSAPQNSNALAIDPALVESTMYKLGLFVGRLAV